MSSLETTVITSLNALPQFPQLQELNKLFEKPGKLYLVGGCVRDLVSNTVPKDFDLTTDLSPAKVRSILESVNIRIIPLGQAHQTVSCLLPNIENPVEITSFHGPGWTPHSSVGIGKTIEEDLSFRDFTINAMAIEIASGTFFDPFFGIADLNQKIVRAVGSGEQRFSEDPLRILRMVRIAAELEFAIDQATFDAARKEASKLQYVAIERIRDEFTKILLTREVGSALEQLRELGFFASFIPELEACVGFEQNRFHSYDVFRHTVAAVEKVATDLTLRLAALFHDIGKPATLSVDDQGERHFYRHESVGAKMTSAILKRLKFSGALSNDVEVLVSLHMRSHQSGPTGIRRILRDLGELYPTWRELKEADARACKEDMQGILEELVEFDTKVEQIKEKERDSFFNLAIDGNNLIALGVRPGRVIGDILTELKEEVLMRPENNNRDFLLMMARDILEQKKSKV